MAGTLSSQLDIIIIERTATHGSLEFARSRAKGDAKWRQGGVGEVKLFWKAWKKQMRQRWIDTGAVGKYNESKQGIVIDAGEPVGTQWNGDTFLTLLPGRWLDVSVIIFYLRHAVGLHLVDGEQRGNPTGRSGGRRPVALFPADVVGYRKNRVLAQNPKAIDMLKKQPGLLTDYDWLLFLANPDRNHWMLVAVDMRKMQTAGQKVPIHLYNSAPQYGGDQEEIVNAVTMFLTLCRQEAGANVPEVLEFDDFLELDIPLQPPGNEHDCGLYLLHYAMQLYEDDKVKSLAANGPLNTPSFRLQIAKEVDDRSLPPGRYIGDTLIVLRGDEVQVT